MTGSIDRAKEALKDLRAQLQASEPTDDPERLPQLVDDLASIVQMLFDSAVPAKRHRVRDFQVAPGHESLPASPLTVDLHFDRAGVQKYLTMPVGVTLPEHPGLEFAVVQVWTRDNEDFRVQFMQIFRTQEPAP